MRGETNGALCLFLTLMLLFCGSARAEFSPGLSAMTDQGALQVEVGVQFSQLDSFSEDALAALNGWLSRVRLRAFTTQPGDSTLNGSAVLLDGSEVFSAVIQQEAGETLTAFSAGNTYMTEQTDALSLLSGSQNGIPVFSMIPASYFRIAPALYGLLDTIKEPKHSNENTSIKNAAASDAYDTYTFTEDEMNAIWPQVTDILLPEIYSVLTDAPGQWQAVQTLLQTLRFSGQCRFKRFLDKEGGDMGLEFTGNAASGEDVRKVTLFGGFTPGRGGYLSLSLPAVQGGNLLKVTFTGKLSVQEKKNTLTFSGTYARTLGGQKDTATLEGTLNNVIGEGTETWSGKAELDTKIGGNKANWVWKPALILDAGGLHGEIDIQKKSGSRVMAKGTLTVNAVSIPAFSPPATDFTIDLRGKTEEEARAAVQQELAPLTGTLMRLLSEMPEDARARLTHAMRSDAWMNAPSVAPLDGGSSIQTEENQWIVSEEVEEP